jgi:hypothetical protein
VSLPSAADHRVGADRSVERIVVGAAHQRVAVVAAEEPYGLREGGIDEGRAAFAGIGVADVDKAGEDAAETRLEPAKNAMLSAALQVRSPPSRCSAPLIVMSLPLWMATSWASGGKCSR